MVKYQKTFLEEINLLLPYLIKFKKDGTIILKKYANNYAVKNPNQ